MRAKSDSQLFANSRIKKIWVMKFRKFTIHQLYHGYKKTFREKMLMKLIIKTLYL